MDEEHESVGHDDFGDDAIIEALPARIPELDPWTLDEKREGYRYTFQAATPTEDPDHAPAYSSPSLALLGIYDSIDLPLQRAVKVHEIDGDLDLLNYESLVMGAVNGDGESQAALDRFAPEFEAKLYNVLCKDLFDHERSPTWYVRELAAVPLAKEAALRTLALRDNAMELDLLKETSHAANRSSRAALIVACVSILVGLASVVVASWQASSTQDVRITDAPPIVPVDPEPEVMPPAETSTDEPRSPAPTARDRSR